MSAPGTLTPDWACFRNRWPRLRKLWPGRCPICRERVRAWRVLLPSRHYRCSCCMAARSLRNLWACGLWSKRGGWHMRHRWRWSMRVCQWLHAKRLKEELADRERRQSAFNREREERWR